MVSTRGTSSVVSVSGTQVSLDVHTEGAMGLLHGQLCVNVSLVSQATMMANADMPWLLSGCLI